MKKGTISLWAFFFINGFNLDGFNGSFKNSRFQVIAKIKKTAKPAEPMFEKRKKTKYLRCVHKCLL